MLTDLVRAADDVHRVAAKFVFVIVLPPLEFVGVHIVRGLDHCNADDDGGERLAVGDVDLDAGAGFTGKLGEPWLEICVAEFYTGKIEII